MKGFSLLILVAFAALVVLVDAKVSHVPSYLRSVGNYKFNKTDTGKFTVKQYYLSQRVTYTWTQCYVICKSLGMRLANIESKPEMENMKNIVAAHPRLFQDEFHVDGTNLTKTQKSSTCITLSRAMKGKLRANEVGCNSNDKKFMCEDVDVVDEYVETNVEAKPKKMDLDIRKTFFSYLGSYENGAVKKSYFYDSLMSASPEQANQICQAFGMILAAPQSQAEFDQLKKLLFAAENVEWGNAAVAGYRSEEKTKNWIDSTHEIKYEIDWNVGEPNNAGSRENCIALKNEGGKAKMNDFPCTSASDFICEHEPQLHSAPAAKVSVDDERFSKFMKPFTSYKINENTKHLYLSEVSYNWVESKLACEAFGMELFMHETEAEETSMKEAIKKIDNFYDTVNIGGSTVGDDYPYNINTGKVIEYELEMETDFPLNRCLQLKKRSSTNEVIYYYTGCHSSSTRFICQKVKPWVPADDITTTPSPTRKRTTSAYEDYEV